MNTSHRYNVSDKREINESRRIESVLNLRDTKAAVSRKVFHHDLMEIFFLTFFVTSSAKKILQVNIAACLTL